MKFFSLTNDDNVEAAGGGVALSIAESVRYQRGAHVEEVTRVEVVCHGNKSGIVDRGRSIPGGSAARDANVHSDCDVIGAVGDDWPRYINSHYQRWNRKKDILVTRKENTQLTWMHNSVCLFVCFCWGGGLEGDGGRKFCISGRELGYLEHLQNFT